MSFIWPLMLLTLLLIPLLVVFYLRLMKGRTELRAELGPLGLVQDNAGKKLGLRRHAPHLVFLLGLVLMLIGLARPELMVSLPRTEGTVVLAFDVSSSMTAGDLEPTRLEAAKVAARTFVENQPRTINVGVVAFSNGGLVVQPPTSDQSAVLSTIDRLSPQGGTSLGHGIFTALNAIAGEAIAIDETSLEEGSLPFQNENFSSAVVVLLTDGEQTSSADPLDIAQIAAEAGVRIYTVGIGSPEGSAIQIDGFSILTQLNEDTLENIANLTNGDYFRAEDEEQLQDIYQSIDLQLTLRGEVMEITSMIAIASLLMMLIGGVMSMLWFGRLP